MTLGYKYEEETAGAMDRHACIKKARSSELISEPPDSTSLLIKQFTYNGNSFMHSGRISYEKKNFINPTYS